MEPSGKGGVLKSTQFPHGYANVMLYDMWLFVHLLLYSFLFLCKGSSDNIFFSPLILVKHVPCVLNVLFQSQPVLFFLVYIKNKIKMKKYKNKYQNNIFIDKIVAKIRSRSLKSQRNGYAKKSFQHFFSFYFLPSDH